MPARQISASHASLATDDRGLRLADALSLALVQDYGRKSKARSINTIAAFRSWKSALQSAKWRPRSDRPGWPGACQIETNRRLLAF
jgi:hypothetical protein